MLDLKKIGYWVLFIIVLVFLFKYLLSILGWVLNVLFIGALIWLAIYLFKKLMND